MTHFEALGLSSRVLKSVAANGFDQPTPIQEQAIPLVLQGHDLIGLAQTGTGKTAAFGLPMMHHLLEEGERPAPKTVRALILAPTRELANQITANIRGFITRTPLKVNCVVGGMSINMQAKQLQKGTDILVATPGRLIDLLERKAVRLDAAKFLVLDEADQMLDLGFIHSLKQIAKLLAKPRQTLMFSATMAKQVEALSQTYLVDPVRVQTASPGRPADKIAQSVHFVTKPKKIDFWPNALASRPDGRALIFVRTKRGADKLTKQLSDSGMTAGSIHGNKNQNQRDRALKAFRTGKTPIMVATDVAARGIDVPGVTHVYNYELPEVAENYVHRIGRTARAGADGEAVAYCSAEEYYLLRAIEKLMAVKIDVASGELTEEEKKSSGKDAKVRRGGGGNRRGSGLGRRAKSRDGGARGGQHGEGRQARNTDKRYNDDRGEERSSDAGKPTGKRAGPRKADGRKAGEWRGDRRSNAQGRNGENRDDENRSGKSKRSDTKNGAGKAPYKSKSRNSKSRDGEMGDRRYEDARPGQKARGPKSSDTKPGKPNSRDDRGQKGAQKSTKSNANGHRNDSRQDEQRHEGKRQETRGQEGKRKEGHRKGGHGTSAGHKSNGGKPKHGKPSGAKHGAKPGKPAGRRPKKRNRSNQKSVAA